MDDQILDALHVSQLNLLKIPYKHALLNHASDDARELISEQLKVYKHPLDCKKKENNRVREKNFSPASRSAPSSRASVAVLEGPGPLPHCS